MPTIKQFSLLCLTIIGITVISFFLGLKTGKSSQERSETELMLALQVKNFAEENIKQAEKFKFTEDSLKIYYSGIDKANQRTNNSINKILKQNEKNKSNLIFMPDSVKLYVIDSMLRAGGYR
jgi:hypothetical protein